MFDQEFQVEFDDLQVINTGGGDVYSVNGKTGDVVLNAQDVGAATPAQVQAEATARQQADTNLQNQINNKVDKVAGKGLSTNDFTNAEKTKLAGLENYDDSEVKGDIAAIEADIDKNVVNNINITASASTDTINLADGKINIKTGATSSETIPFPVASTTSAGVMNSATYQGLLETTDIANGLLEGAVAVSNLPETPTQTQISNAWKTATGRTTLMNRAVVYDVTNQKLWTYYTNTSTWYPVTAGGGSVDVQPWTNTQAGIVKGSTTDGQIFAENDGTGSVNGWDEVKTDISNLENAGYQTESQVDTKIATAIAPLETDIDDLETGKQDALTAGDNIDITNNVISATDTTYTAGDNITISTDNEISADVPELLGSTGQSTVAGMTQKAITDALASAGGVKVLTEADYNYPASNPTSVALWLLEPGLYSWGSNMYVYAQSSGLTVSQPGVAQVWASNTGYTQIFIISNDDVRVTKVNSINGQAASIVYPMNLVTAITDNLTTNYTGTALDARQGKVLKDLIDSLVIKGAGAPTTSTVGTVGKLYEDTTNGKLYQCTAVSGSTYTWTEVGGGGGGVTLYDNVASRNTDGAATQRAIHDALYGSDDGAYRIQIGQNSFAGSGGVAIGASASAPNESISVGSRARGDCKNSVIIGNDAKDSNSGAGAYNGYLTIVGYNAGQTNEVGARLVGSIYLGAFSGSLVNKKGMMDISSSNVAYGYNGSSNYRLLTGVHPGINDNDAVVMSQLNALAVRVAALEAQLGNA